jgi:hypothetical protein
VECGLLNRIKYITDNQSNHNHDKSVEEVLPSIEILNEELREYCISREEWNLNRKK